MRYAIGTEAAGSRGSVVRLPPDSVDALAIRERATFRNPAFEGAEKVGASTDMIPEVLEFAGERDGWVVVPRHFPWRDHATRSIPLVDSTVAGEPFDFECDVEPYPYQVPAIEELARRDGIVVAPCGSGKTVVLLSAIAAIGRVALVLVPTEVLALQWCDRVRSMLKTEPGRLWGGVADWEGRGVVVALPHTVVRGIPDGLAEAVGVVATDEVHMAAAPMWTASILKFPARRRIAATATVRRGDGLSRVFLWHVGPVVHEMRPPRPSPRVLVVETGVEVADHEVAAKRFDWRKLAGLPPESKEVVKSLRSGKTCSSRAVEALIALGVHPNRARSIAEAAAKAHYSTLVSRLAFDEGRNELAAAAILGALAAGRRVACLLDRVEQVVEVAEILARVGLEGVGAVVGTIPAKLRERAERAGVTTEKEEALAKNPIVATSKLVEVGFDAPDLDLLVDVGVYGDAIRAEQSAGRVLRVAPGKPRPIVIAFEDGHGMAKALLARRLRTYERRLDGSVEKVAVDGLSEVFLDTGPPTK